MNCKFCSKEITENDYMMCVDGTTEIIKNIFTLRLIMYYYLITGYFDRHPEKIIYCHVKCNLADTFKGNLRIGIGGNFSKINNPLTMILIPIAYTLVYVLLLNYVLEDIPSSMGFYKSIFSVLVPISIVYIIVYSIGEYSLYLFVRKKFNFS